MPGGTLSAGAPADITVLAPDLKVRIDARAAAIAIEEHAVRRLGAARRRRRDASSAAGTVYVNPETGSMTDAVARTSP